MEIEQKEQTRSRTKNFFQSKMKNVSQSFCYLLRECLVCVVTVDFSHFSRNSFATKTREHWIQRITFAAETNAALRCAVAAGRTDRQTITNTDVGDHNTFSAG